MFLHGHPPLPPSSSLVYRSLSEIHSSWIFHSSGTCKLYWEWYLIQKAIKLKAGSGVQRFRLLGGIIGELIFNLHLFKIWRWGIHQTHYMAKTGKQAQGWLAAQSQLGLNHMHTSLSRQCHLLWATFLPSPKQASHANLEPPRLSKTYLETKGSGPIQPRLV